MVETYVINLQSNNARRQYVVNLLASLNCLSVNIVPAVEGKLLSDSELSLRFDAAKSYERYGRTLNRGEIGCTLSHYDCYHKLLNSGNEYALILEDDITLMGDLSQIQLLIPYIETPVPTIIFLSGDYWYLREQKLDAKTFLSNVYDAVGSYAYLINKSAARLIVSENSKPSCAADNWSLYRSQGIKLKAIRPYLIDANIEDFESTIKQSHFGERRSEMSYNFRIRAYWMEFIKRVLVYSGRFVSKIRK